MPASLAIGCSSPPTESQDRIPREVATLLAVTPGPDAEQAWTAFLARYSGLLLRVAEIFGPGYDEALDRYAFMLDELSRSDCRRLRGFAADGRSTFSTWLAVVARRLCLDHYRLRYGRPRSGATAGCRSALTHSARRSLVRLEGALSDLSSLPAPEATDFGDALDHRERLTALHRVLERLPAGDQLLIRLRFTHELTAREIAPMLGFPSPFHVYRRLDTICRCLRELMEGNGRGAVPDAKVRFGSGKGKAAASRRERSGACPLR